MQVTFPDGSRSDIDINYNGSDIDCVAFGHFGGDALYDAMYDLADRSSSIIVWPSPESFTAVTDEAVVKDLPKEFSSDLSLVKLVHSGAEIEAVINSSFSSMEALASFCLDHLKR